MTHTFYFWLPAGADENKLPGARMTSFPPNPEPPLTPSPRQTTLTWIPMEERGVFRYSSALDTRMALSQVSTELWLSVDGCLFPAITPAASMAMVTALVLSRLSVELYRTLPGPRPRPSASSSGAHSPPRGSLASW